MQPVTLFYRIGGVNYDELRSWMKSNRDLLKDSPTDEEIDSNRTLAFLGLSELVRKAVDAGEFPAEAAPRIQAWYFCLFWMPGYLQENLNLTLLHAGLIGWMPFLCADLGGVASGVVSDRMVRNGAEPWRARRRVLVGTAALAPLVMLIPFTAQLWVVIFAFCALALVCQVWLFNMTTMVADVFPRHTVASVLGLSGSFGALGGLLSNALIGSFVGTLGFTPVFFLMGCVHLIAAGWIALFIRGTGNPNPEESIQASGV